MRHGKAAMSAEQRRLGANSLPQEIPSFDYPVISKITSLICLERCCEILPCRNIQGSDKHISKLYCADIDIWIPPNLWYVLFWLL